VSAYLGYGVHGFPNLAYFYGPLSPSGFANGPTSAEVQGDWVAEFLIWLREHGISRFEPELAASAEWTAHAAELGAMTLFPEARSWYMGDNIPGKPRQLLNYPSLIGYASICDAVAAEGYRGFHLD
jgi:hypothetical protein